MAGPVLVHADRSFRREVFRERLHAVFPVPEGEHGNVFLPAHGKESVPHPPDAAFDIDDEDGKAFPRIEVFSGEPRQGRRVAHEELSQIPFLHSFPHAEKALFIDVFHGFPHPAERGGSFPFLLSVL